MPKTLKGIKIIINNIIFFIINNMIINSIYVIIIHIKKRIIFKLSSQDYLFHKFKNFWHTKTIIKIYFKNCFCNYIFIIEISYLCKFVLILTTVLILFNSSCSVILLTHLILIFQII